VTTDRSPNSLSSRIAVGLSKIALALKSYSWQDASQQGLTPTQGQILTVLRSKGKNGMRLSAIAEELAVTAASASDTVTALVEKELVQKTKAVDDGRAIAIFLTVKGERVASQVLDWPDFLLEVVSELSEIEQEVLLRGLLKTIALLQQKKQISINRMCINCQFFRPNIHPNSELPHHCTFVDAAFGDRDLRLDCTEQIPAAPEIAAKNWQEFY
jgi:DNA-binding MarR family transcriptional regulator